MRLKQDEGNVTDGTIDALCISLLVGIQKGLCAGCSQRLITYQVDHKRYGEDITLYDLQLLCGPCHARKTGVKAVNGLLRTL